MKRSVFNVKAGLALIAILASGAAHAESGWFSSMVGAPLQETMLWIGQYAMRIFTALFILLAAVLYVGQFIFTQVLIKIGMILMPIMVPFMMFERTKFVFEGWVKFMVTAGFTKLVGAILFGFLSNNIHSAISIAQEATAEGKGMAIQFSIYSTLLLLTALTAYIMTQTQQIGNSLVSGFVQGGFRFSPVGWGGGATSALGRSAGSAARGAGDTIKAANTRMTQAKSAGTAGGSQSPGGATAAARSAPPPVAPAAPSATRASTVQRPGSGATARMK